MVNSNLNYYYYSNYYYLFSHLTIWATIFSKKETNVEADIAEFNINCIYT